jgi:hypothetical protein
MNTLPVDRALSIYETLADRTAIKGTRERLADGFAIRSMAGCWKENSDRRSSGSIPSGFKLYSYRERSPFVRFQRDLLR